MNVEISYGDDKHARCTAGFSTNRALDDAYRAWQHIRHNVADPTRYKWSQRAVFLGQFKLAKMNKIHCAWRARQCRHIVQQLTAVLACVTVSGMTLHNINMLGV